MDTPPSEGKCNTTRTAHHSQTPGAEKTVTAQSDIAETARDADTLMRTIVGSLSLDPDVRLHQGASAMVTSLGMLGDKYIEILPGDLGGPPLQPGAELEGSIMPSFDDVMQVAVDIGAELFAIAATTGRAQMMVRTGHPNAARAVALADASISSPFLEKFGRSSRDTGLESDRNNRPTAAQRLHMLPPGIARDRMATDDAPAIRREFRAASPV